MKTMKPYLLPAAISVAAVIVLAAALNAPRHVAIVSAGATGASPSPLVAPSSSPTPTPTAAPRPSATASPSVAPTAKTTAPHRASAAAVASPTSSPTDPAPAGSPQGAPEFLPTSTAAPAAPAVDAPTVTPSATPSPTPTPAKSWVLVATINSKGQSPDISDGLALSGSQIRVVVTSTATGPYSSSMSMWEDNSQTADCGDTIYAVPYDHECDTIVPGVHSFRMIAGPAGWVARIYQWQ